jgi:hypothetical protein
MSNTFETLEAATAVNRSCFSSSFFRFSCSFSGMS